MRFGILVCVALAVGCSDSGSSDPMPVTGNTAGTSASGSGAVPAAGATAPSTPSGRAGSPAAPTGSAGRSGSPAAPTAGAGMTPTTPPAAGSGTPAAGSGGDSAPGAAGAAAPTAGTGAMPTEPAVPQNCDGLTGMPGRTVMTVENAGVTRSYILDVPDSYAGDKPVPLMLNFHPLLFDAAYAESNSMYRQLSEQEGFIVAFPDGQESAAWNVGPCCTQSRDVDDVGFTRALVKQIQENYCVDKKRIYASGFSMGGGMSHYLACEAADLFAAVAPGHFDLLAENTCAPARPITVIFFRSESDFVVPYEGGVKEDAPNGFRGRHTFLGAVGTFEKWAEINKCTDQPIDEGGGCQTHKQCDAGVEVTLCTVPGGHSWQDPVRSWETISRFTLP